MTPYCTLTEATDYLDSIGINSFIGDDALRTKALMRATLWLDNTYGRYYPGVIINPYQEQLYPRTAASDLAGRYYQQSVIPPQIKQSVALMAQSFYNEDNIIAEPLVQREVTTVGPIKTDITYADQKSLSTINVLTEIDNIMFGLTGKKVAAGGSKIVYWG